MDWLSIFVVIATTLLALVASSYSVAQGNIEDIKENWVKYRCNPIYMPLAGLVGSDVMTNFMNCTMSSFQIYIAYALGPIYEMFGILTKTVGGIQDTLNNFRGMISGTKNAFLTIVDGVYRKLNNTLSTSVRLISRIRNLSQRVLAIFITVFHMVNTGVATGNSVANGPVGQAAAFFCFAPSTQIQLKNNKVRYIRDMSPGDVLSGNIIVESVLAFDGTSVQMYILDSVAVSGNHKVMYQNKWIRVENHPKAFKINVKYPILYCLNTSNNTIPIGKNIFKDYEETSDPKILSRFETIVEYTYNGDISDLNKDRRKNPLAYRHSGTSPQTEVSMANGFTKLLREVTIGDTLVKGGRVLGIVLHKVTTRPVYVDKIPFSKGTWMFDRSGRNVYTIGALGDESHDEGLPTFCMNLLTENGCYVVKSDANNEYIILDDQETTESWVHDWRDIQVQKEVIA